MSSFRCIGKFSLPIVAVSLLVASSGCELDDDDNADLESARTLEPLVQSGPCDSPTKQVSNLKELQDALEKANPGDTIRLAAGPYYIKEAKTENRKGKIVITRSGTKDNPILLCGSKNAVLSGQSYGLHVKASHWILRGFTVEESPKGIMLDGASHVLIDDVHVRKIGTEGVHFRTHSTHNTIQNSKIEDVGVSVAGFGEGVYIGSSKNNWGKLTDGAPDKSDYNEVLNNTFGPNIRAEAIDIKEGTRGGRIVGNRFYSEGLSGENSADSWIDIKGNEYLIQNNVGKTSAPQLVDGFQVRAILEGWGERNTFEGNRSEVMLPRWGIFVHNPVLGKNTILCSNDMLGESGLTNDKTNCDVAKDNRKNLSTTTCDDKPDGWWCMGGEAGQEEPWMAYCEDRQIKGGCFCSACKTTGPGTKATCTSARPPEECIST